MNSEQNLRIKTAEGNRYGNDGYSGDMSTDTQIMSAINSKSPEGKILTSHTWEVCQKINLLEDVKAHDREQFSQIKDQG